MSSLKVSRINEGVVIDHIPAGNGQKILEILDTSEQNTVSVLINVESGKIGEKDILKIEDKELSEEEIATVSVFASGATLNLIENEEVAEKRKLQTPEKISGVLECPNPDCITNTGEPVETSFTKKSSKPVKLQCSYCENIYPQEELGMV